MNEIILENNLLVGNEIDNRWFLGPFSGIKKLSAKAKGKRFEQIAEYIFKSRSLEVKKPISSDHDRIVDGKKFEIKGSTITQGTDDTFSFLQIRPAQDYDYLILETFWFDGKIQFYKISKKDVLKLVSNNTFKKQHGGNKAKSGTFSYNGKMSVFEKYFWFDLKVKNG
jgi:hypothetical protein